MGDRFGLTNYSNNLVNGTGVGTPNTYRTYDYNQLPVQRTGPSNFNLAIDPSGQTLDSVGFDFNQNQTMQNGTNFDTAGAFDIGLKGLGAAGSLYSMFQQSEMNKQAMDMAKSSQRQQKLEVKRRNDQRAKIGAGLGKAVNGPRTAFN